MCRIYDSQKYNLILADPSWKFNNKITGGTNMISGAASCYPVMSLSDICDLDIESLAADNSVLLMWWVASQPQEAIDVCNAWGFKVKTMSAFNWVKKTVHGKPYFGMGFWTRAGSELCLLATRGKPKPASHSVRSVFEATNTKHSRKPSCVRDFAVQLCGDVPRIELFAREAVEGWDAMGYEIDGKSIQVALEEMK